MRVFVQLRQRSAHQPKCRCKEDYEAVQHAGFVQENLPRIEAPEAFEARECAFLPHLSRRRNIKLILRRLSPSVISSSRLSRICEYLPLQSLLLANSRCSYFVTELLGTDLHRLLTSRPLEKQFIQYFLYQILVNISPPPFGASDVLTMS
jgi:hypothetical protein